MVTGGVKTVLEWGTVGIIGHKHIPNGLGMKPGMRGVGRGARVTAATTFSLEGESAATIRYDAM